MSRGGRRIPSPRLLSPAPLGAAILAVLALALAGNNPAPEAPSMRLAASGDMTLANSRDGVAIFTASDVAPGETTTGDVILTNMASAARSLQLVGLTPVDTPGSGGGELSEHLELTIERVSPPAAAPLFSGKLRDLPAAVALADLPANGIVRYRFTVTLPEHGPAVDDAYAGSSMTVSYRWQAGAVGTSDPGTPGEDDPGSGGDGTVTTPVDPAPAQKDESKPQPKPEPGKTATVPPATPPATLPQPALRPVELWLGGGRRQRLNAGQRSTGEARRAAAKRPVLLMLLARCRPGCDVRASATMRVGLGTLRLKGRALGRTAADGRTTRLAFRLTQAELASVLPGLSDRRRARVQLVVRASAAGHAATTLRRTLYVRR
jgi:hypothetical protein